MSADLVVRGTRVVTPAEELAEGWVAVRDGRIDAVGEGEPPAAAEVVSGAVVAPGFVDLHVHGGGGDDFMSGDATACERAARFHARHGTTGLLATTVSAPREALAGALRAVAGARDPVLLGAHLEGPWLSEKRRGAQPARHLRAPDLGELAELAAAGPLRMVSLAPELPGALEAVAAAAAAGAVPALAHTDATYEQAVAAVEAGARHAVHVFNGMRPLHHREPGVLGAVLESGMTCELILDGRHVHPAAARLLHRLKGAEATVLITDAIAATGMPDGEHALGDVPIRVAEGRAETLDGHLAGSTLTMDAAVRHAHAWFGVPLAEAVAMASTTPARVIGLEDRKGRLAPGFDADLVLLDDALRPTAVWVGGRRV